MLRLFRLLKRKGNFSVDAELFDSDKTDNHVDENKLKQSEEIIEIEDSTTQQIDKLESNAPHVFDDLGLFDESSSACKELESTCYGELDYETYIYPAFPDDYDDSNHCSECATSCMVDEEKVSSFPKTSNTNLIECTLNSKEIENKKDEFILHILNFTKHNPGDTVCHLLEPIFKIIDKTYFEDLYHFIDFNNDSEQFLKDELPIEIIEFLPKINYTSFLKSTHALLLHIINDNKISIEDLSNYINMKFIFKVFCLFFCNDLRICSLIKIIVQNLYRRFLNLREFIREMIKKISKMITFEQYCFVGISEFFDLILSIISGFTKPLKTDNKKFIENAILPINKLNLPPRLSKSLKRCLTESISKDSNFIVSIFNYLLKNWPTLDAQKEIEFLGLLLELFEYLSDDHFTSIMYSLFEQLSLSLVSPHVQVAFKVILFWSSDNFTLLFYNYFESLLPKIVFALEKNLESHWNNKVVELSGSLGRHLLSNVPQLYIQYKQLYHQHKHEKDLENINRTKYWDQLEHNYYKNLNANVD